MSPKTLVLDIETSPAIVHAWGLFNQNVGVNQIIEPTRMICFAAKWRGKRGLKFASEFHDGREEMLKLAWQLLDEADVVEHYNGTSFDMPHFRREFVLAKMPPPSPCIDLDLYRVVRKNFRFLSNKLQHVSVQLGLEGKMEHEGHPLWVRCLEGDEAAWARMRRYNKRDVLLTEELGTELAPWMPAKVNSALFSESDGVVCPKANCGAIGTLTKQGFYSTTLSMYQRYRCSACGGWSHDGRAVKRVAMRGI